MDEIQQAMAKAFFASAWADQCEEAGESGMLSGQEIMNVMPATLDPAALSAARTLAIALVRANGGADLETLLARIVEIADGDREPTAENFGHYAAMQAMGHGVGLYDAFGKVAYEMIRVPYVEFGSHSLENDYFDSPDED